MRAVRHRLTGTASVRGIHRVAVCDEPDELVGFVVDMAASSSPCRSRSSVLADELGTPWALSVLYAASQVGALAPATSGTDQSRNRPGRQSCTPPLPGERRRRRADPQRCGWCCSSWPCRRHRHDKRAVPFDNLEQTIPDEYRGQLAGIELLSYSLRTAARPKPGPAVSPHSSGCGVDCLRWAVCIASVWHSAPDSLLGVRRPHKCAPFGNATYAPPQRLSLSRTGDAVGVVVPPARSSSRPRCAPGRSPARAASSYGRRVKRLGARARRVLSPACASDRNTTAHCPAPLSAMALPPTCFLTMDAIQQGDVSS
jgi:hypothetical protein